MLRIGGIVAVVFFLLSCTTLETEQKAPEQVTFSLGEIIWVVHNNQKAMSYFSNDLHFSADETPFYSPHVQVHSIGFQNHTRIHVASVDSQNDLISRLISENLAEREGVAFVGIRASSLDAVKDIFRKREIPYSEVNSTTAKAIFFPEFPRLRMFYFYQQNLELQPLSPSDAHENSAQGLEEAWIAVDDFYALESDFAALGMPDADSSLLQPFRTTAKKMKLKSGSLHFVLRDHLEENDKQYLRNDSNTILGVSIRMDTIEATAQVMGHRKIKYATTRYNEKSCILIPARYSFGSWLELARPMN